jgi:hypothetical protein
MKQVLRWASIAAFTLFAAFSAAKAEEVTVKQGDVTLRGDLSLAEGKTTKDGVILMLHGTLQH